MIADMADDCETNRVSNDNYRLDMTYIDQDSQRRAFLLALESQSRIGMVFHRVIVQKDSFLAMFMFEDIRRLRMTCRLMY